MKRIVHSKEMCTKNFARIWNRKFKYRGSAFALSAPSRSPSSGTSSLRNSVAETIAEEE